MGKYRFAKFDTTPFQLATLLFRVSHFQNLRPDPNEHITPGYEVQGTDCRGPRRTWQKCFTLNERRLEMLAPMYLGLVST